MGRRRQFRQAYHLDSGEVTSLSRDEAALVLRAAEDLITTGGRTLLVKILRGSQAKDIRPEHRSNPAYGVWKELSQQTVSQRVDWCIENEYLGLEYFGKLPLLVYPRKGLAIECQTIAGEWYERAVKDGLEFLLKRISEVPLNTVMAFLDQVAENGKEQGLPILESFQSKATKRISKRINSIIAEWNETGYRLRCVFDSAWFDESLPPHSAGLFRDFAKTRSILAGDWKFVGQEHPGMMDVDIYTTLLKDKSACLVTTDRPFHNSLLRERISSFYYDSSSMRFTAQTLPGVEPRGILVRLPAQKTDTGKLSDSAEHNPFFQTLLETMSESSRKRFRTKRRRIHNFFGGTGHIQRCGLTVSLWPTDSYPLIGIRLRVVSSTEVQALDATEQYFLETSGDPLGAYIQSACLMILLRLESLPLDVYYDTAGLVEPKELSSSPVYGLWTRLIGTFAGVEWHPINESARSPKMEALRRKLKALSSLSTNEVKRYDSHQFGAR